MKYHKRKLLQTEVRRPVPLYYQCPLWHLAQTNMQEVMDTMNQSMATQISHENQLEEAKKSLQTYKTLFSSRVHTLKEAAKTYRTMLEEERRQEIIV